LTIDLNYLYWSVTINKLKSDLYFLAGVMKNPESIVQLNSEVSAGNFDDILYYEIYCKIADSVIGRKIISYTDLKLHFKDDAIAFDVIAQIEAINDIPMDIQATYDIMIDEAQNKKFKDLIQKVNNNFKSGTNINSIISDMESSIIRINTESGLKLSTAGDYSKAILKDIKYKMKRYRATQNIEGVIELPTGLTKLDEITLGFQRKNTWVLGASTGGGKTMMAVKFMHSILSTRKPVLYFLLEDASESLIHRLLALRTGIKIHNIRCGKLTDADEIKLNKALKKIKQNETLLLDDTSHDVGEIINKIKFAKLKYPDLAFVVVDYIGLASDRVGRFGNKEQEIASISNKLISVSKDCNICTLILQQLNTSPDERSKGMPIRMNDLRDSKTPGFGAAVTLFLHFPFQYKKDPNGKYSRKYCKLIVGKNRYGETNKMIDLISRMEVANFEEGIPTEYKDATN